MATREIQTPTPRAPVVNSDRWKEHAAEGKLCAAMGAWMATRRDFNESAAEVAVFRYIRSLPKRKAS